MLALGASNVVILLFVLLSSIAHTNLPLLPHYGLVILIVDAWSGEVEILRDDRQPFSTPYNSSILIDEPTTGRDISASSSCSFMISSVTQSRNAENAPGSSNASRLTWSELLRVLLASRNAAVVPVLLAPVLPGSEDISENTDVFSKICFSRAHSSSLRECAAVLGNIVGTSRD